jgi:hypothetical protein
MSTDVLPWGVKCDRRMELPVQLSLSLSLSLLTTAPSGPGSLHDNTQHSQQTDIHVPGRIRSHNLSTRAAAYLHLRPRGHWDRHFCCPSRAKRHSEDGSPHIPSCPVSVHILLRESFTLLPCSVVRKVCTLIWTGKLVFSGCPQLAGPGQVYYDCRNAVPQNKIHHEAGNVCFI